MLKRKFYAYSMYKISLATKKKAEEMGVSVKQSATKNKKIDVFKNGKKVASVGDSRFKDYHIYKRDDGLKKANERKRLYKIRHQKTRVKTGTPSYYADKLLWS